MPVEKRSFLFRYFDKIVCGVIAVVLIAVVIFAVKRNRGDETRNLLTDIEKYATAVEGQLDKPAPEKPVDDYVRLLIARNDVKEPELLEHIFPLPGRAYKPVWLGTQQTGIISFGMPLVGPPEVSGPAAADVLKIAEFPVDGDFTKVRVQTMKEEGEVELTAQMRRSRVVRTVYVKEAMNAQAYPPDELTAVAIREGIALSFKPNPKNVGHVAIDVHQIWRQDPRDAAAGFTLLWEVPARQAAGAWTGAGPIQPAPTSPPGSQPFEEGEWTPTWSSPTAGAGTGEPTEEGDEPYFILDEGVHPDGVYVYKVRSMPQRYYQKASEFTDKVQAETLPNIDFRYVSGRASTGRLRFEVAKHTGNEIRTIAFENRVGDMIGGVDYDQITGRPDYYLTWCYLVDCHYRVRPEMGGSFGRITYVDRRGRLQMRYRNEVAAPDLWEEWE